MLLVTYAAKTVADFIKHISFYAKARRNMKLFPRAKIYYTTVN